ncbi:MAG: 16S rRNA (cytidine(1402)-2'-O)-methyltransferase [Desulfobulbaceae bacterium A2]|nr:MAG: 16S rRNA (cytidine(1402)-2'-O)-methyltransferase [Desulfobulbaceae bacterium A2]
MQPGTLYVVATPIGNLEDLTLRAARILGEVDLVACEDTRHTKKLLAHLGLSTPCLSYYREREQERAQEILARLAAGGNVALVSDAGTPGISDPGGVLVRLVREAGIAVIPIPGPCALAAAVSVAGLPEGPLLFAGFAPAKSSQRLRWLAELAALPWPLVLYEAPHRIEACLRDCLAVLGDRPALMLRELTKLYEEHRQQTLAQLLEHAGAGRVRGELVLVIAGATPTESAATQDELATLLHEAYRQGLSQSEAVRRLCREHGVPRGRLYQLALEIWHEGKNTAER